MKRLLLIFVIGLSLISFKGSCQQIRYYPAFDSITSNSYFYLIGNIYSKRLVLKLFADDLPELLIFNDSGRLVSQRTLSIPELKNTVIPKILVGPVSWTLVLQHQESNMIYVATARLNENGDLLQPYMRVDSSRTDKLGDGSYYHFALSDVDRKIILYRMILGLQTDKFLVDYLALNAHGELIERGSHFISFRKESEEITPLFQHSNGKTYFAIYNKPDSSSSKSMATIYQLAPSASDLIVKKIDFSKTKLIQPVFASNSPEDELSFVSLYTDPLSMHLKGLLISKIDLQKESENPALTILPFDKTRNGEFVLSDDRIRFGYRESRGDFLTINSCSFLSARKTLSILFENRYSYTSTKMQSSSTNYQTETGTTVWGQSNLTPSQEFDLLRNYSTTPATVNQQRAGNGSFYTIGLKTAPVSTQYIIAGPFSEILADRYNYSAQPVSESSDRKIIKQERTQLQFDHRSKLLRKEKLTIKFDSPQIGVESGNSVNSDELVILNYAPNSNGSFIMQLFDTVNPPYQALLYNINGFKPFYGDSFSFAGQKKIYTLFTTSDNKKIGLAEISW